MADGKKSLLDPETLAKLATLKWRVRSITEGILAGLHKSPHHGQSVEFAEHKEYAPGDEIRHIDWKAFARFDKYYVKRFEQETNLRAWLVVDSSASMGYRGVEGRLSKFEYASALAASLAYLLVRQQDAAGLAVVDRAVVKTILPRAAASHLSALVETLEGLEPRGETRLAAAVDFLVERAQRRSSVVIFSDLFDPDERVLRTLTRLRKRKLEVTVFHVLDPTELTFPFEDPTLFLSMEDGRSVEARGRDIRNGYLESMESWLAELKRVSAEVDLDYTLCPTDRPVDEVLVPFLARRERGAP